MQKETILVRQVAATLREKGIYLCTAESCSGGLLGHIITNLPGSSDFYLGGFITYSNDAKQRWLGVPKETLENYGAVSKETVLAMAQGARNALAPAPSANNVVGVSISGIAGPTGGSPQKPVGTVWIGISVPGMENAFCFHFKGKRSRIKRQSAIQALAILREILSA